MARLTFAQIFKPKAFEADQDPKYQASFLLDPTNELHARQIKAVKKAGEACYRAQWGDQKVKLKSKCFGTEEDLDEVYDGWADMFWVRTSKNVDDGRPLIIDIDGQPLTAEDGRPYSGCYVDATFSFWAQDNRWGKRINGNLRAIRFRKHGEAFGRAMPDPDNEFSSIDDDDDDGDEGGFLD